MKKIIALVLTAIFILSFTGCGNNDPIEVPEDFAFSLAWSAYRSSYDSQTGKLVKTTYATNEEDYVTYYSLTEEDREYIYSLIEQLNINSYPDEYDPKNGYTEPPMTIILTVIENGTEKTVKAENISILFESRNRKGQAFLSACEAIIDRLTSTEEWKALPDYEFYVH